MCWVFLIFIRFCPRNLYYIFTINLRELCTVIYLLLGGGNAATPHYPTVELRMFGGLGVRKV